MSCDRPVHIVDDDPSVRRSLRFLLSHAGYRVTSHESGERFLSVAQGLDPGCVLLDVRMNGLDGLAVLRRLRESGLAFVVVIVTGHGDVPMAVAALKAGAIDFLAKPFRREELLAVIERAMARLAHEAMLRIESAEAVVRMNVLTAREREVLDGLTRGLPNKTIAHELGISPRTVEIHRANLMQKLAVRSFPEALRIAFAAGFPADRLSPPA
jgi:two-component system response regulator FixJ